MHNVRIDEIKQRGCRYCADCRPPEGDKPTRCIHDECPYRKLDEFKTYKAYLETVGGDSAREIIRVLQGG